MSIIWFWKMLRKEKKMVKKLIFSCLVSLWKIQNKNQISLKLVKNLCILKLFNSFMEKGYI